MEWTHEPERQEEHPHHSELVQGGKVKGNKFATSRRIAKSAHLDSKLLLEVFGEDFIEGLDFKRAEKSLKVNKRLTMT